VSTGSVPEASDGSGSYAGPDEQIEDGTTLYLKFPHGSAFPDADASKPWVRETLPSDASDQVGTFGFLGPLGADPLTQLERYSSDVTEKGPETVDGVQATHYAATITPQDEHRMRTSATGDPNVSIATTATDPADLPTTDIDVWVDGSGIVRRLTMDMTGVIGMSDSSSGSSDGSTDTSVVTKETGTMTMSFDLLTVNEPVHVFVPPPDQVTTLSYPTCPPASPSSTTTTSPLREGNTTGLTCVSTGDPGAVGTATSEASTTTSGD
jgi:hypothetical protein